MFLFESSVNSEYSKTKYDADLVEVEFESSVNSEYSKTKEPTLNAATLFESSVNSEYSKTDSLYNSIVYCLRVV